MDKQAVVQPHNGIFLRLSRKEIQTQDTAWRNLGDIQLREMSWSQKDESGRIPLT